MSKHKELDMGITVKFYELFHSAVGSSIITSCIWRKDNKPLSRGIAIRSLNDEFQRKLGRTIAYNRAFKAFIERKSSGKLFSGRFADTFRRFKFKIKTDEDIILFQNEIAPLSDSVSVVNNGLYYTYTLPMSFPLKQAEELYGYKCEYKPLPATHEIENQEELEECMLEEAC